MSSSQLSSQLDQLTENVLGIHTATFLNISGHVIKVIHNSVAFKIQIQQLLHRWRNFHRNAILHKNCAIYTSAMLQNWHEFVTVLWHIPLIVKENVTINAAIKPRYTVTFTEWNNNDCICNELTLFHILWLCVLTEFWRGKLVSSVYRIFNKPYITPFPFI